MLELQELRRGSGVEDGVHARTGAKFQMGVSKSRPKFTKHKLVPHNFSFNSFLHVDMMYQCYHSYGGVNCAMCPRYNIIHKRCRYK